MSDDPLLVRGPVDALRSLKDYVYACLGEPWEVRFADEDGTFQRPYAAVWATGDETSSGEVHFPRVVQPFQVLLYPEQGATPMEGEAKAAAAQNALWLGLHLGAGHIDVPGLPTPSVAADGALTGGMVFYRVTAANRFGETTPSAALVVTTTPGDAVTLTWGRVAGASRYRVYRGPSADTCERVAEVTAPTWRDDGTVAPALPNPPLSNRARAGMPRRVPLYSYVTVPVLAGAADPLPQRSAHDYMTLLDFSANRRDDDEDPTLWTVTAALRLGWRRSTEVPSGFQTVQSVTTRPA